MREREGMEVQCCPWNCLVMVAKPGFEDLLVIYRRLTAFVVQNDTLSC
jgi:hypothetical protein